jgi:hypothetical protein
MSCASKGTERFWAKGRNQSSRRGNEKQAGNLPHLQAQRSVVENTSITWYVTEEAVSSVHSHMSQS